MKQNSNPDKLSQAVAAFYETHGAAFSGKRQNSWGVMRLVREAVKAGDVLVDVGSGNGRLGLEIPDDVGYVAIEPSSSLRAAAEEVLSARNNVAILEGGFPHVPAADASADVVSCLAVIHHLTPAERAPAIQELSRILKPGGTLIMTAWNLHNLKLFRNRPWLERLKILVAAWLRLPLVRGGGAGDVWVSWKADGQSAGRYVHAFTLRELMSLFSPGIWDIKISKTWGQDSSAPVSHASNLVIVAKKK